MTEARVDIVVDTVHGQDLVDPYRWMEQEGPELREWLSAQGKAAHEHLVQLPLRAELLARLDELTADTVEVTGFTMIDDRVFFLRQTGDVPVLVLREGDAERVLLDPGAIEGDEHSNLDWYEPSPDGNLIACGISRGGGEFSDVYVLDAATGELTETPLRRAAFGHPAWLADGSGFTCQCYPELNLDLPPTRRRNDVAAWLYRLGQDEPTLLVRRGHNPSLPMTPIDRPHLLLPKGSELMFALILHQATANSLSEELADFSLYAAPRSDLDNTATCQWRKIADPDDELNAFVVHGDTVYVVTNQDAPRGAVQAWSLTDGTRRTLVPGGERAIMGTKVIGDHLLIREADAGFARLRRVPLAGGAVDDVPLPGDGMIVQWSAHPDGRSALIVFSSWTQPPTAYRYDGEWHDTGWIPPSPVEVGDIELTQLRVPARDGVLVPLSVLHRKGITLDGGNPAILNGYGSYGLVLSREFNPRLLPWLEHGGLFAVAGLRGGGEYGHEWRMAGSHARKDNTINDFIDCAEHLIATGYTRPDRLAGLGGSAGGIPTGGAIVRRPELWAAMIMQVAVTNVSRMEFTENGPVNAPEFGSIATEQGLRDLLIVDSYLRVVDGTGYPAVLLTVGLNDIRVAPWQPAKMAARLQAATGSDRPVLLRVDEHAGHGAGSTREQRNMLIADLHAFVASRTGLA